MLNHEQFKGLMAGVHESLAAGKPGGFTVTTETGEEPEHGVVVAMAGGEVKVPNQEATGERAHRYASKFATPLKRPGHYMGAWAPAKDEKDHGDTYFDTSQVIHNPDDARLEMMMQHQKAAWDLDSDYEIHNHMRAAPKWRDRRLVPGPGVDDKTSRHLAENLRKASRRPSLAADEASMWRTGRPVK